MFTVSMLVVIIDSVIIIIIVVIIHQCCYLGAISVQLASYFSVSSGQTGSSQNEWLYIVRAGHCVSETTGALIKLFCHVEFFMCHLSSKLCLCGCCRRSPSVLISSSNRCQMLCFSNEIHCCCSWL